MGTSLEELSKAADDALLKRHQLLIARIALAKWQGELALNNYVVIKIKGVSSEQNTNRMG